ncbi:YciI family protein [Kribbella sp. CA-247076]|uniref:YciI family protein n=1 Tax=Kribbella sp. CA-247076 TaxID=3239941 RepID=UPI003D8A0DE7
MRFIAVLRTSEAHGFPPPELHEGMAALGAEAARSGVLVDSAGLLPIATATRVGVSAGRLTVADGPFEDPNPLGAYAVYDASRDEVIHWTKRFMDLHRRAWPGWEGESEIRQIFGPEQ